MLNFSKFILCILPLTVSCQSEPLGSLIFFRAEVEQGSKDAIACDYLENVNGTVWFGPPHPYTLQYATPTIGHGGTHVIAFEIVDEEKESFSDFTESTINKRMAIEVNGKIYAAPNVNSRLPGSGIIDGGSNGFSEEEVRAIVAVLREGNTW